MEAKTSLFPMIRFSMETIFIIIIHPSEYTTHIDFLMIGNVIGDKVDATVLPFRIWASATIQIHDKLSVR